MLRSFGGYLLAILVAYGLGAVAATQSVVASLGRMGVTVSVTDRVDATLHDLVGLAATYAPLIALALAIALPVAALVVRWLPGWRRVGYVTAGLVAIVTLHLVMRQVLDLTAVAATRSAAGLLIQGLAGAVGGYVFWFVVSRGQAES